MKFILFCKHHSDVPAANRSIKICNYIKEFFRENFKKPIIDYNDSNKKRIEFIDLAKGICILLVVTLHCSGTGEDTFLKALRMPFYFILSGIFFKDYGGLINFLHKKLNKILIPFLFFFTLPFLLFITPFNDFIDCIFRALNSSSLANGPLWFLICLFWTNIIYCIISLTVKKFTIRLLLVLLIDYTGFILSLNRHYLPLYLSSACSATPFFFIGTLMRKLPILYKSKKDKLYIIIGITIMISAIAYCSLFNTPYIEMGSNRYIGNWTMAYIVSLSLVFGLLMLCKIIGWLPIISYIGRYSIIVLGIHFCYILTLWKIIPLEEYKTYTNLPYTFLCLPIVFTLSWISIPIFRKYFPHFTAQADII